MEIQILIQFRRLTHVTWVIQEIFRSGWKCMCYLVKLGTVESGRCWVKAADVWSKVADVKAADVESKRPMLGPKWPMFGPKQPMFHRPLFWPKVADVVWKRPMSPKSKAADVINFDMTLFCTHKLWVITRGWKRPMFKFWSNVTHYAKVGVESGRCLNFPMTHK